MGEKTISNQLPRRVTRRIHVGRVPVGGGSPISVQSMTKTDTRDIQATVAQILSLEAAGCEIVRCAVPDQEAAQALKSIRSRTVIPLVADIHFDHRLALAAMDQGIDGLRINPGNIGSTAKIKEVVAKAKDLEIPIRIGVNSGSVERDLLAKYGGATAEVMVESALRHIRILEDNDFEAIKVSLKASDIFRTLRAYEGLAGRVDYPFHAGITESGGLIPGTVKSSAGLALLLDKGLADTIRVSLTAPPEEEVRVAYLILRSLELRRRGPDIVSCPVCGRCEVDLFRISAEIESRLSGLKTPLHIAVMGCVVNGPGEAKEADIGLACGRDSGVVFKQGRPVRKLRGQEIVEEFVREIYKYIDEDPELSRE